MIKSKTSEELLEGITSEQKVLLDKNDSDTSICSKRLSIITDDELENEDLRIVGIKVSFEPDGQYSVTQDNRQSKSAEDLTVLENPIKLSGTSEPQIQLDKRDLENNLSDVQRTERVISPREDISKVPHIIERSQGIPAFELKLTPICEEDTELELFIKSRKYNADSILENESTEDSNSVCGEIIQDKNETNTFKNELHQINPFNGNPSRKGTEVGETADVCSTATQTEKEVHSSSDQTTYVEVHLPKTLEEISTQTEYRQRDATTVTDITKTKSIETETDGISNSSICVQTEPEIVTGSSQTETAAIYSIDSTYDASSQTEQVKDRGTITDFDIYIVNRENVCDKVVDTQDLPYDNLIVAREEKAKDREDCKCRCASEEKHQNKNIPKYCCHTENVTAQHSTPVHCMNQQLTSIHRAESACNKQVNYCYKAKYNSNSPRKCYKCEMFDQMCNTENQTVNEKILQPKCLNVTEMEYASRGIREIEDYTTRLQIAKALGSHLKTIVAVPLKNHVKIEKAEVFKIPIVIQHVLVSFHLAVYAASRVVINPIEISLSDNQSAPPGSRTGARPKESCNDASDKILNEEKPKQHLGIENGVNTKSITVRPIKSAVPDSSRLCRYDSYCVRVRGAMEEKQHSEKSSDEERKLKLENEFKKRLPSSTSPKIKSHNFNYTSKDPWKPLEDARDDFIGKKTQAIDIVHIETPSSQDSVESVRPIDLYSACETVNDHLLNLRAVEEDVLRKSAATLHKMWFEVAATKDSNIQEVKNYLRYFQEFSYNLLKTLLHSVDNNGNNVLHFAYANNRFDLAEELLRSGYVIDLLDKANKLGYSPLMVCAISQPWNDSDWSIIRSSFQMGDANGKSPKSGQTPLMSAASRGFCDMVKLLLESDADPNLQDKDGSTALMYAAEHGHEGCVKVLMRNIKCDPTIKDTDGQSACSIALSNGHKNIAVLIHMQALEKKRMNKRYVWTNKESRQKVPNIVQKL